LVLKQTDIGGSSSVGALRGFASAQTQAKKKKVKTKTGFAAAVFRLIPRQYLFFKNPFKSGYIKSRFYLFL